MDNRRGPDTDLSRLRPFEADTFMETMAQRSRRLNGIGSTIGPPPPERRSTISSMIGYHGFSNTTSSNGSTSRMRNLSGGSVGSTASGSSSGSSSNLVDNQYSSNNNNNNNNINSFSQFALEVSPFANTCSTTTAAAGAGPMPAITNLPTSRVLSSSSVFSSSSSSSGSSHRNTSSSRPERSGSFYGDSNSSSNSNCSDRHGSSSPSSSSSSSSQQQQQQQQSQRSVNSSRYKTELCRPFEESGSCKYGDKCQFAHGMHELRSLSRHPKYKTELCRTFHKIGYCPYGPRCHFIHEEEPGSGKALPPESLSSPTLPRYGSVQSSSSGSTSPSMSPSGCSDCSDGYSMFTYQSEVQPGQDNRQQQQYGALTVNINNHTSNGSSTGSSSRGLDTQFGLMNLNTSNDNGPEQQQRQQDIFSQVTMFSEDELLDNSRPAFGSSSNGTLAPLPFLKSGRQQLDNFPAFSEGPSSSLFWHKAVCSDDLLSCLCPVGGHNSNHYHSPTGSSTDGISSSGSDSGSSGGSECGGSTENLNSSVMFEWRSPVAIGQY